ncbi:MAG: DUF3501 family protein [Gammaproteobacteria bacterium]|nr:MAG: DUF3501 family protein [Gammaproteobacteria bacterium]
MKPLTRNDLYSLEEYARARPRYRAEVLAHKKNRQLAVGPHATLYFEDRLTVQYQIQEMLRIERIFEAAGIEEELSAYNPLIPDGSNLKATLMLEYTDVDERHEALQALHGIEERVWLRAGGEERVRALADEDLERATDEKTSAVHFLRFELDDGSCRAIESGAPLAIGIDHTRYRYRVDPLPERVRAALAADID